MRNYFTLLFCFAGFLTLQSQSTFKNIPNAPYKEPLPIDVNASIKASIQQGRTAENFHYTTTSSLRPGHEAVAHYQIMSSGSFWIDLKPNEVWKNRASVTEVVDKFVQSVKTEAPFYFNWNEVTQHTDKQNLTHIKVQQTLAGIPIKNQEMILHLQGDELKSLNGFAWTASIPKKLTDPVKPTQAIESAGQFLLSQNVQFQKLPTFPGLHIPKDEASLIWMPESGKLILAYQVNMHPNALDHWTVYVNAGTLEIMQSIKETCSFAPMQLFKIPNNEEKTVCRNEINCRDVKLSVSAINPVSANLLSMDPLDGPTITNDQDLLGQNRVVNGYQVGVTFFMLDASRSMFDAVQSKMPNEPVGVIWTVDAQNSSPEQNNFEIFHVTNSNNNWQNLEVSAHYNSGQAFEYFRTKFNRNSINGDGGNVISIINVTDQNDNSMDNAFWSQTAMYYGNGNVAFQQLARGLDVAGHEMSHGVIDNTANLEYLSQSGALNESYADVFGAMIDRDDWRMGEDVVKINFFPSGALRDLQDPHNGGTNPNDNGWQPAHMNEYQVLPETPDGDNGGVHVNSGIPNRAFFLFATAVGKEKAEQVYYKALTDYLVKSSQFIDMRLAAEKAATDLHGAGSAEVNAVRSAFDQVGILNGQGGDYEEDIETNDGDDFVLATDNNQSDLYFVPPTNPNQFVKMNVPPPISRPSFTDDGFACVYVDDENNMIVINFNWSQGLDYQAFYIENNPQGIWRNIVVSKDGTKIAFTTANLRPEISVFDFDSGQEEVFELYNPTTAEGIETGDVLYADAMEWDYSGEYVMYDALNEIESSFGNGIQFWDISFLQAWDNGLNDLGPGLIGKLYSALPENISIGNPSFAKNSPYIITFDFAEDYYDNFGNIQTDYWVIAANIENGTANNIYHNTTVGYPSYSRLDDKILFTYYDIPNFTNLLATINVQPADKTLPVPGTDVVFFGNAQKGVWFNVGNRDFTSIEDLRDSKTSLWPSPAHNEVFVSSDDFDGQAIYKIYDLQGKLVQRGTLQDNSFIHVSNLITGNYVIHFTSESGVQSSGRFVKE